MKVMVKGGMLKASHLSWIRLILAGHCGDVSAWLQTGESDKGGQLMRRQSLTPDQGQQITVGVSIAVVC